MRPALRSIADPMLATRAVSEPWLGIGSAHTSLLAVAVLAVLAAVFAVRRKALSRLRCPP